MKPIPVLIPIFLLLSGFAIADEPERIDLWPRDRLDIKDNAQFEKRDLHRPDVAVYLPENPNGAGVMIFPGGGYGGLSYQLEGIDVAKWLNQHGIAGFVVKYRHRVYKHPVPCHDAQRAFRIVASRAKAFGIDPNKLGVIGFSAGGHLASTVCTTAGQSLAYEPVDAADDLLVRPAFACLLYPVISMRDGVTHGGSRRNLLGDKPTANLLALLSNDEQVNELSPPTLLIHCATDKAVPLANSQRYLAALRAHGVPGELVTYHKGRHGSGLRLTGYPKADWSNDDFLPWLREQKFIP